VITSNTPAYVLQFSVIPEILQMGHNESPTLILAAKMLGHICSPCCHFKSSAETLQQTRGLCYQLVDPTIHGHRRVGPGPGWLYPRPGPLDLGGKF
jgi:hypothetical protein